MPKQVTLVFEGRDEELFYRISDEADRQDFITTEAFVLWVLRNALESKK
jgi:hypothetical protein